MLPNTDRQPPTAPEAEISVLGACLIDEEAFGRVVDRIDDRAFYREGHRRMWRAMMRTYEAGGVVEPTAVSEELKKTDELDAAGGLPYIAELLDAVPTAANVEYHAGIVADRALLRRTIGAAEETIRECYDPGERRVRDLLDAAESRILTIAAGGSGSTMKGLKPAILDSFSRFEDWQRSGPGGVKTGFGDVDRLLGGMEAGDLVVLAARPSMGKTALASQIAVAAADAGRGVGIYSFEMSTEQLTDRLLCTEAMVDSGRVRQKGGLRDDDYARLAKAAEYLSKLPLWMDYSGSGGVLDIRAKARRLKAEHGELGLVVVDYLQLMTGERRDGNRVQEVSDITRGLKTLAGELAVPVLALSQLSRNPESRTDKRPHLSDLRESGSIEQDADVVMFLYRPEYYMKDTEAQDQGVVGKAELAFGKNRNGPTGTVDLFFRKECTRFEDFTDAERPGW